MNLKYRNASLMYSWRVQKIGGIMYVIWVLMRQPRDVDTQSGVHLGHMSRIMQVKLGYLMLFKTTSKVVL